MAPDLSTARPDVSKEVQIDLRSGPFSINLSSASTPLATDKTASNSSRPVYKVDRDKAPTPIKAWAIPDMTEVFDRLSPDQQIRAGDLVVVRYRGPGLAGTAKVDIVAADATYSAPEKISSLRGRGVHADSNPEKDITSLFRGAYYDWRSQSYNREATWDPSRPGATEIFVMRAKQSGAQVNQNTREAPSPSSRTVTAGSPEIAALQNPQRSNVEVSPLPVNAASEPISAIIRKTVVILSESPKRASENVAVASEGQGAGITERPLTLNQLKRQRDYLTNEANALRSFIDDRVRVASKRPESDFAVGDRDGKEGKALVLTDLRSRARQIENLVTEQKDALKGFKDSSPSRSRENLADLNGKLMTLLTATGERVGMALAPERQYADTAPALGARKVLNSIGGASAALAGLFGFRSERREPRS